MPNPKNLINWGELSRRITDGNRFAIRKDSTPQKYQEHQQKIDDLIKAIENVVKGW